MEYLYNKNSYLQARASGVPPKTINRSVALARQGIDFGVYPLDHDPYFNHITSAQPCIPLGNIDVTRRPTAFGRWAMPKLRRELHSADHEIRLQAISSISDLVHDPERGYEAIRLKIPDRMADLIVDEDPAMRERIIMTLITITGLGNGKEAITKNATTLGNLSKSMDDEFLDIRLKTADLLKIIANFWKTADYLVDFGFVTVILDKLLDEVEEVVLIHLHTLKSLMYCNGKDIALNHNGFQILRQLLEQSNNLKIIAGSLDCLMYLLSTSTGKKLGLDPDFLVLLNRLLHLEDMDLCANAASAIMFSILNSCARVTATKIVCPDMPKRLVNLANNRLNPSLQIPCIKALTILCEHPNVRSYMLDNHLEEIWNIQIGSDPYVQTYKETLLSVVNWKPYE